MQASGGEPVYAIHPLIVVGEQGPLARELEAAFQEEVRAIGVTQVPKEQVAAFLKTRERTQCLDDACLAALAKATGATRALRMTLAPHAPQFAITGKIVGTDEVEKLGISRNVEKTGGPLAASARAAIARVLRIDMALGEAELADLTPETPEPIVKTVVVDKTPPWRKPAAYATAGLAGAALVGGVVMKVLANGKWDEANRMRAAGTLTPAQNQALADQMGVAQRDNTLAISALIGGAVLGAASGFLFATSADATPAGGSGATTKPAAALWSDGRGAFALISVPLP